MSLPRLFQRCFKDCLAWQPLSFSQGHLPAGPHVASQTALTLIASKHCSVSDWRWLLTAGRQAAETALMKLQKMIVDKLGLQRLCFHFSPYFQFSHSFCQQEEGEEFSWEVTQEEQVCFPWRNSFAVLAEFY